MSAWLDFMCSPEFAELGCYFLGGALTGTAITLAIELLLRRRMQRKARSRRPYFLFK